MKHVLRRAGFYLVAFWASITINFLIPRLAPGDPAGAIMGRFQGKMNPAAIHALWTLNAIRGWEALPKEAIEVIARRPLEHPSAAVRRNAALSLPPSATATKKPRLPVGKRGCSHLQAARRSGRSVDACQRLQESLRPLPALNFG